MRYFNFTLLLIQFLWIGCSSSEIIINERKSWQANEPRLYSTHIPVRITIHHEGVVFNKGENAPQHIKEVQVWGMGAERNWTDIPYHFLIDPDGNIYEGRNVFTAGETATEYDPSGHLLLTCMGNFEEQEVFEEQLESLIRLTAWCCIKYQIDPETIAAHKDYAETLCPGKNLYLLIENGYIKEKVIEIIKNQ